MGYYETRLLILVLVVGGIRAGCPSGTYLKDNKCLVCPEGFYENNGTCTQCPLDKYNDEEMKTECKACPEGKKTLENGSISSSDCIDVCEIPTTYHAGYRVSAQDKLYTISSGDRVAYTTELLFVCSPGYQFGNTNTNKQTRTCSANVDLPKFCIRIEASQEGEAYLISTQQDQTITVSCYVYPVEQTTYTNVHFFRDDTRVTGPVVLVANGDHKSASYTVDREGTWRCGLSESITDSSNKPVSDAVISKLTLSMNKPTEHAVATSPYTISCEASYLDTMSLPALTLTVDGKAVPSVTSDIQENSFRISKTFSTPTSEMAGAYVCASTWGITDGATIGPSKVEGTVDFLGFKTEYPAKEDGTNAEVVMVSVNSAVTLICDTFSISGAQPIVKFFVDDSEVSSSANSHTLTVTGKTTVHCTATVGSQTVTSKKMTLLNTDLSVELTPALVYGAVGDTITLTCSMTGDNVQLLIRTISTAILNTYLDGSNTFTTDSAAVDEKGTSKFNITITRTDTWARCGMYISDQNVYFYSAPVRIYYRESSVDPSRLVMLAGQSGSFTLKVFGDPSKVTVSNNEIEAVEDEDKSSDWMKHYDVPVTNAKTKWYGPLDFSITYDSDKDVAVEKTNLYVTDVTVKAYSENIAEGQDIVLTCSHVNPPFYNAPTVTWFRVLQDGIRTEIEEEINKVEMTNGKDETVLKIKSVTDKQTGHYACAVQFKNNTDVVKLDKTSDSVLQNVVGHAFFSDLNRWMGERIGEKLQISCTADQQRPKGAPEQPTIGVECQDSDEDGWVRKIARTTLSLETDKVFTETFDVTMKATMNNRDCRCYGQFYDGKLERYEISSPLTRVFAYDVQRFQGYDEKHFSMIGHSVTMKCSANGDGTVPIQWKKDNQKITESDTKYTVTPGDPIDGVYTSTLIVSGITVDLDGEHMCYVHYRTDVQLDINFTLHVLRIEQFKTANVYENEGSAASITCKVSQIDNKVPTVTWNQDGDTAEGCIDPNNSNGLTLTCVRAVEITEQLTRSVSCSVEYLQQPTLKGQSQKSGSVTIVSQRVWSDQRKVTVVEGKSTKYVCYASGNTDIMMATLDYPGNPKAKKVNIGDYESKFTFDMATITKEKKGDYQCELNFASIKRLTVKVEIMALTKKFPEETTYQTLGQVQNFTCATNLLGESTNAKIRFEGGPMADKNLFEYFDTEGEASSTLTLKPITKSMNIVDYTCSVEIKGSDADGDLTDSGRFVVQYVQLDKTEYFGVDTRSLSIPCVASGKEEDVEKITWTLPGDTEVTGNKKPYVTANYSLKSVLSLTLSPDKEGDYKCGVAYDPYPHEETLNLKILKIENNPKAENYLKAGSVATISCVGSAPVHSMKPTFQWNYVSDINTEKQEACSTTYNPNTAGTLPAPTNEMSTNKHTSTIKHMVVQADHLRSVNCRMSWSGTDADGSLTTSSALIVVTYIDALDEVYVIEGQDGEIMCTVYGPDSVDITWYKGDDKVASGRHYDITKTNWDGTCHRRSSTLTVKKTVADSEGVYKCKSSHDNDSTTDDLEKEVNLKVYRVVDFTTDKGNEGIVVTQFDSASLACIASYPGGTFNFIKIVAGKDPEPQFSDYEVTTDKGVAAGWNIKSFDVSDKGEYECKIEWNDQPAPVKRLNLEISLVCQRPAIDNGILITEDPDTVWIKENETGTVTCESGYTLSGESSVKCLEGKLTTPTGDALSAKCLPVPEKRCVVLPVPANGRFNCDKGSDLVCSVKCNEGYLISDATSEYRCKANSGENWNHVDENNPLGKTATCDRMTERTFTYEIGEDSDCSSIKSCDSACAELLNFTEFDCTGTTITLKSLLNSTDVLDKLKKLPADDTNKRKRRNAELRIEFKPDQNSCDSGSALRGEYCVECSAGYYANNNCNACPAGQYTNQPGQSVCKTCDTGLSTLGVAASHSSECIEVCEIPEVIKGKSYPPKGYSVPTGTVVTLTCNSNYDLEYNQVKEVTCAEELPKCYRRCEVVAPPYDNNGLKEVEIGDSSITKGKAPSLLCGANSDVKCSTSNTKPTIAHGFPIKAVCIDVKAMANGKTEQILYCQENTRFTFPDCSECKVGCSASEWQCNSDCSCIANSKRCDKVENCMKNSAKPEISDEYDCPVKNEYPEGIQFDHWQDELNPNEPVEVDYTQESIWKQFAACFWLQSSYKGLQTVFSYGGKIGVSVHNQDLSVHFNFDSQTTGSTFSNKATGITNGNFHRVCISWNSVGGVVDLYYEDKDIINDEKFKTWSVSSKSLPKGVVKLTVGGTENSFHGFIKDMLVMEKQLIEEDIDNFRYCKFPAEDSTRITWSVIRASAWANKQKHVMKYNVGSCLNPECKGSCPVDMFMCGSCDCVSPWQRCDLFTQHCIDNKDEDEQDCKKTNGVFKPYNEQRSYDDSKGSCVRSGGYLASLDSAFENNLSARSLEIDDIRTAWIGMNVDNGKQFPTWASGAPKSQWALDYYTDTTKVTTNVGLKNDKDWLPIYGLFSEDLPYLCRTQGYLIAKLDESDLSIEDWREKCKNDLTNFTLADDHYTDIAISVLESRGLHNIDGWEGVAWAKSDLICDYMKSDRSITKTSPTECAPYWNIPSFCGVQVELEQVTQATLSGTEDSYFLWDNPWADKLQGGTSELSVCFNLKSADEAGTVLRYSAGAYQNEILVYVSSKSQDQLLDILEFTAHNRVNFFAVQLLDGVWHSVCLAWKTATGPDDKSGTANLVVDGKEINQHKTLAVWPKNLYNAKLNATGTLYIGRQGDSSYTGSNSKSRTLQGSIMNLNVWKQLLKEPEMVQMTKDSTSSFKCGPIVVQEASLILRWRDLLHYSSSGVKISTTRDHDHCGILYYESDFYATKGGRKIKLKSANGKDNKQAVRYGDTVRIVEHDHNNKMVLCDSGTSQCPFNQCSVNDPCGTEFILSSNKWEIGRAVAITDEIFLKTAEKTIKGLTNTIDTPSLDDKVHPFVVTVDYTGWKTTSDSVCDKDCQKVVTRRCEGGTEGDSICPGDKDITEYCACSAHGGCEAPPADNAYCGTYQWKHYKSDQWFAICPYGAFEDRFLPLTVVATCENNEPVYENTTCSFQSEAAQALYKILYGDKEIADDNVAEVAEQTSDAIQKADDLGTLHVKLGADIMTKVANVTIITTGVVDNVLNVFDNLTTKVTDEDIQDSKAESNAPKKLVDAIETAAKKMKPETGQAITLKKKSVGMKVMDIPETQKGSVSFSMSKTASQPIDEIEFSTESLDTDGKRKRSELVGRQAVNGSTLNDVEDGEEKQEDKVTVSIEIAEDVAKTSKQLSFVVYNSSKMFVASRAHAIVPDSIGNPFESGTLSIQSSVLGGSVDDETANKTNVGSGRSAPAATLTMSAQGGVDLHRTPYCVYWDDAEQMWSQTGLQITSCKPGGVSCSSDHLTNFAVLMNIGNNTFSPAHQTAMTVLTVTGSALSILCLTLTVVGLAIGKMRRNPTYHIHLCLALTLGLAMLIFLIGLDRKENFVMCKVFAVLIHYLFLASICWMLVEGVNLYIALIIVFGVNHKKMKIAAHCFSWGFPALICLITVLVDAYVTGFDLYEVCMTAKYCFLNHRGRMYFFVAPIMLMMAINIFIFVRVIIVLAKATKNRDGWTDLRQVTVIASITGISWVFGAMTVGGSVGTLVFNYLYIILNSFQGIVIFYFHCFGKPDVRNAWTEKLSTGTSRFITSSNSQGPASYGTTGRKISAATGMSGGDQRYSTATAPRISTVNMPGQSGGRLSAVVPPGPRVGAGNNRPNRFSVAGYNAPLSPMPFQANPNPRRIDEQGNDIDKDKVIMRDTSNMTPVEDVVYEELDIKLQPMGANDEEAAYDTIEIQKDPDQATNKEGTATRRMRRKQEKDIAEGCLVEENQYVTLDEGKKTTEENNEEEKIEEKEEKILNTDKQEDLAIEDVELAPAEPEPAVSSSNLKRCDSIEGASCAGPDMVYLPATDDNPKI